MTLSNTAVENSLFGYIPNLGANAFAVAIASILLLYHISAGALFRQWWFGTCWAITMLLELLGYAARVRAKWDISNIELYEMQSVCLVIGPVFMTAGLYYLLAKYIQVHGVRYSPLRPMTYSAIFITCDVFALFLQGAGGGLSGGSNESSRSTGKWVMVGGTAFQAITLFVFVILHGIVVRNVKREINIQKFSIRFVNVRERKLFPLLAPFTMISAIFVFIRSIYRAIEFGKGLKGPLLMNETYFLVLDGLMILLGSLPFLVHPGMMLGSQPIPVQGVHTKPDEVIEDDRSSNINLSFTSPNKIY